MENSRASVGLFLRIALVILLPVFSSCDAALEPVAISVSNTPVITATNLSSYEEFQTLVETADSFVLTITNPTCSCTTEFLPHYNQYLVDNGIPGYTLVYSLILYEIEKYQLPVVDSNSPILTIYDTGLLKYSYSYETGNNKHNRVFTSYDGLNDYLGKRIDVNTP